MSLPGSSNCTTITLIKIMKKIFYLILINFAISFYAIAQKPTIDSSVYGKWPSLDNPAISSDGKYVSYYELTAQNRTLIIQEIHGGWKLRILNASSPVFTEKGDKLVFAKGADSLGVVRLGSYAIQYINNARSFQLTKSEKEQYLVYLVGSPKPGLIMQNLANGKQTLFTNVKSYFLSSDGTVMLMQRDAKVGNGMVSLDWVSLEDLTPLNIYKGTEPNNFTFDKSDNQLCFLTKAYDSKKEIYYYKTGMQQAQRLAWHFSAGVDSNFSITGISSFTFDGGGIFVDFQKEEHINKPSKDAVMVDVWSYTDFQLQSAQLANLDPNNNIFFRSQPSAYTSVININQGSIIQLAKQNEFVFANSNNCVLIYHYGGGSGEGNWNSKCVNFNYLVSTTTGNRTAIDLNSYYDLLSPDGKYALFFDEKKKNYFSYEISTGKVKDVTQSKLTNCIELSDSVYIGPQFIGWLDKGHTAIICDQNDIWKVNLATDISLVNLTNGYGRLHHIVFRLVRGDNHNFILPGGRVLLTAFDQTNKNNGFYSIDLNKQENPQLLTMGQYVYYGIQGAGGLAGEGSSISPMKARDAEAYIVSRMSAAESPNYFWTKDFKTFAPITDIHPERAYNWMTSELVNWKTFDDSVSQGILYKPENFDPKKKYPLIFYYYDKYSGGLNKFLEPEYSVGTLNIPEYVSNGYLVFVPDIHYKVGHTGESAFNSVVSAAKYLSKRSYIDSTKMGIQGHSFGGYETYYIVSHTNIFSAACAASGISDFTSDYLRLMLKAYSNFGWYEDGICRIGSTPWERPDLYIKNSPVFYLNNVTTPLLALANKNDDDVVFDQGLEVFLGMRRLGKKAWMLQYDNGSHTVSGDASKDFTIRMRQFFDHYLRGAPAPKWMVEGIPAKMKGIDNGLELEPPGVEPGPGLLTPEEQRKVDSLQYRKPITVTIN